MSIIKSGIRGTGEAASWNFCELHRHLDHRLPHRQASRANAAQRMPPHANPQHSILSFAARGPCWMRSTHAPTFYAFICNAWTMVTGWMRSTRGPSTLCQNAFICSTWTDRHGTQIGMTVVSGCESLFVFLWTFVLSIFWGQKYIIYVVKTMLYIMMWVSWKILY